MNRINTGASEAIHENQNFEDLNEKISIEKEILMSGAFDLDFYNEQSGNNHYDLMQGIAHYLNSGWKEGFNPHQYFDANFYKERYKDVAASGLHPFLHFVRYGYKEAREPSEHFSIKDYLRLYPEVNDGDINPLAHYTQIKDFVEPEIVIPENLRRQISSEDEELLRSEQLFNETYYLSLNSDVAKSGVDPLTHYIELGWRENRNPSTRFDTQFYLRAYPDVKSCPLLHYVRHGIAEGRKPLADYTVSFNNARMSLAKGYKTQSRIAIHAHLFYPDIISELCEHLIQIPFDYDLLVSTTTQANAEYIENYLSTQICQKTTTTKSSFIVRCTPNIGRDIGPMLTAFKDELNNYEYICHLHSKKSPHSAFGGKWRYYLFDQLVGSKNIISAIIRELDENQMLGVLFPDNFLDAKPFVDWAGNLPAAKRLFRRLGLNSITLENTWEFPAGSMCWMRTSAIAPLLSLTLDDFREEDGSVEGTLAHVIERSLIHVAASQGYEYKKYIAEAQNAERLTNPPNERTAAKRVVHGERWMPDQVEIATHQRFDLSPLNRTFNPMSMNIHWVIPDFSRGQGGHMTIFRHIYHLDKRGHKQTVWIRHAHLHATEQEAKEKIQEWYQPISDHVIIRFLPNEVKGISGDAIIATDAWTVYPIMGMPLFKERFYFIQDYEALFQARGSKSLIAENTYKMGLKALPAGPWLQDIMSKKYQMWARQWDLAYDPMVYFPSSTEVSENFKDISTTKLPRIAFYARQHTPRRAVDLGLLALDLLYEDGIDIHVDFFGEKLTLSPPYAHSHHNVLEPKELGELYRECDIGVVFSATNYSLIPMEMMACDLPVIELDTESTRAVFDESNVEFATPDPIAIAEAILNLLKSAERRKTLISGGRKFVASLNWEKSARVVEAALLEGLSENSSAVVPAEVINKSTTGEIKASVFIPTFNGGSLLGEVLDQVVSQKTPWNYEVLVIDSGSTDGTVDLVKSYSDRGVRLHEIPNSEFQHGKTRNQGIGMTEGEFIAILTQDAIPCDENWLLNLVAAFDASDIVAGVFGKHIAYSEASPFVQRDINNHFFHHGLLPRVTGWDRGLPSHIPYGSEEWQQNLHFFSDNNACIRRSVWNHIPYPEIDWGEDQVWAWEIIKQGYEKVYEKNAVVYHSHNLNPTQALKIGKHEGQMFLRFFSYSNYANQAYSQKLIDQQIRSDRLFSDEFGIGKAALAQQHEISKAQNKGRYVGALSEMTSSRIRKT